MSTDDASPPLNDANRAPYAQAAVKLLEILQVSAEEGLPAREVAKRRAQFGDNTIPLPRSSRLLQIFKDRVQDILVLILLLAAVVSWLVGERTDAVIIGVALLLDTTLSLLQLWRTEHTLALLRQHVEQLANVIREGRLQRVPSSYLVVGDIIEVRAGERIPADARVLQANGLRVEEAALTGESRDVAKAIARLTTKTPLGNQTNMLFLGTIATSGSGRAVVTATGTHTEFGKIAQLLKAQPSPESPLRKKLQILGRSIGITIVSLVAVLVVSSILLGRDPYTSARTAITLIVSAIPEDLTVIFTIVLTIGMLRILRKRGVVRELKSAETLGAATVICTDKTGTLTQGNMRAVAFDFLQGSTISPGHPPSDPLQSLAYIGFALGSDAHRTAAESLEYVGSATERTALQFVEQGGFKQADLTQQWRRRDSLSFSPEWKYRASLHDHPTQHSRVLFVSGAPEVLLEKSTWALTPDNRAAKLTSAQRVKLQALIESHAARGDRLLAMAVRRHVADQEVTHRDVTQLLFLGVLIIADPIRDDVRATIQDTLAAGVAVKLITGDYEATARAIAREVGLTATAESTLNGDVISSLSDSELTKLVDTTTIFARVSPLDKQRIVRALQSRGHVVAMTGDGVNDAVALKGADIGVAMGSGKDIAKDAADLVLLNDSFTTIVHAIREGRVIRDNLRKVIAFLLSTNIAEVALFFISLILRGPLPLLPAQILWINLVTDGTSDIALSLEPQERNVMRRPPESPSAQLLGRTLLAQITSTGIIMTVATALLYWYLMIHLRLDETYSRTMVFTFLSVTSLLSTWSFRSLSESLYRRGLVQNPWIMLSLGFSLILQLLAVYQPAFQRFFNTVPLDSYDWLIIVTGALATVALIDLRKIFFPYTTQPAQRTTRPRLTAATAR